MVQVNDGAPDFMLLDDEDRNVSLASFVGLPLVIYFYPKDDTPGCTSEAKGFSNKMAEFNKIGVSIVGVSPDTADSHRKFKKKYDLSVRLLSDLGNRMSDAYSVFVDKSMFGKKYKGIERSTFLLDGMHKVIHVWRNVTVAGHVDAVLETASMLLAKSR